MLISKNWLGDYVDVSDLSADVLERFLNTKVAEVEGVTVVGEPLEDAVVVIVQRVQPHPTKDGLNVVQVVVGAREFEVVCGAPNVRVGMSTVYVPVGGRVHSASGIVRVEDRQIGGVVSHGVLVSESELGISNDHSGIVDFKEYGVDCNGLVSGLKASEFFGGADVVMEIDNKSLTHRPDLWSHFGFARELSAILKRPLKDSPDRWVDEVSDRANSLAGLVSRPSKYKISIDPASKCRRFVALEIEGVKVRPSPVWLRRRLFSVGAGIRNLLVDLSNYVMLDIGQPNHTYDADALVGDEIFVRPAGKGELFLGLDGIERKLTDQDCVIADSAGPVALGGVIGGSSSAVGDGTTKILLESANFYPSAIRFTTKLQQVRTDASNRFEKSLSPFLVPLAIQRYVELLFKYQPEAKLDCAIVDCFIEKPAPVIIDMRCSYVRERLGVDLEDVRIVEILSSLGFEVSKYTDESGRFCVKVPYYRATRDVSIVEDLVEEVGRVYGYELIPEQAPLIASAPLPPSGLRELENQVSDTLRAVGFSEEYSYPFISADRLRRLGYSVDDLVELENPMDAGEACMRSTLVPSVLSCISLNLKHRTKVAVFEVERGHEMSQHGDSVAKYKNMPCRERRLLTFAYVSGEDEAVTGKVSQPAVAKGSDFYAMRGVLSRLISLVTTESPLFTPCSELGAVAASNIAASNIAASNFAVRREWMHPYRSAEVSVGGKAIGIVSEVHPGIFDEFDIGEKTRVIVSEIDLELLLSCRDAKKYVPFARFPESLFEMSIVAQEADSYSEIESFIRGCIPSGFLRGIELLSVYQGKPLEVDQKSVSLRLRFGIEDRTVSAEEMAKLQEDLICAVRASKFGLRG